MKTFNQFLRESLVDDYHASISARQKAYNAKRDNCGPAALDMAAHIEKTKGIKLTRVIGHFTADHVVHDKDDFTKDMKREFHATGKEFNNAEHRKSFIENHPKYKDEWKKVPHHILDDKDGNIHDPSGHDQLIKTGLAKDLHKDRYKAD